MKQTQITFDFSGEAPSVEEVEQEARQVKSAKAKAVLPKKEKSPRGRKSLKVDYTQAEFLDIPEDDILFQKQYYAIGDVANMFKLNASLIRYWEKTFDILKPMKNGKGDRHFRPEDVKNLKLIYNLLRERKYTIEGAKEFLKNSKAATEKYETIQALNKLKGFLLELKASL
ncbi:MAG: MerR family transcriptional regulator [Ferruginibacter sp.]